MKVLMEIKPILWIKSMYVAKKWFIKAFIYKSTGKQLNGRSDAKQLIIISKLFQRWEVMKFLWKLILDNGISKIISSINS